MQAVNRVVKNTAILYARMAITVFISLYTTRLVLIALGINDYGLFNVVGGIITMLGFLNTSMATSTQRFMSYSQGAGDIDKVKNIFNISLVLHGLIAMVAFVLFEIVGYILFHGVLNIAESRVSAARVIYQFVIVSTLFTIVSVPYDAVITSHENMTYYAILGIIESVLKLAIAFYITYSNFDHLILYGMLMALLSIILLIQRRIYCDRKYPECEINIRSYFDKKLFKEMTGFAGWSLLGSATSLIAYFGQGVVINIFFGTVVNAAQGISNQVSGYLSSFAYTMQKALNPIIDKSAGAGNRSLMLKATMTGTKISFFLLMIFFIPVLIEMPYIFSIWLKEVPVYAILFCRLLLIQNLIEQMYFTLNASISAVGDIRRFQIITSIFNVLPLIVAYFLFSLNYPAYVLYVVFIIYTLVLSMVVIYFANINCELPVSYFLKNVVLRSLCSFILVFILALIPSYLVEAGLLRLIYVISISLVSFITVVWFIGFSVDEHEKLYLTLNKVIYKFNLERKRDRIIKCFNFIKKHLPSIR